MMAQTAVGAGVVLIALALAAGAISIPSAAGYGGIGANFLPWAISAALALCGMMLIVQARTTGFRALEPPTGAERGYWPGFAWVTAGLLANAALITTIGFILSCTLCYMLAVQGLRRAAGEEAGQPRLLGIDVVTGLAISAPVFWLFTKLLAIKLPGLTSTGWL